MLSLWLPVILWAGVIFGLSSLSNPYRTLFPKEIRNEGGYIQMESGEHKFRLTDEHIGTAAHTFSFLILAMLAARAARPLGAHPGVVWGAVMLYAISDEIHQIFVPARQFQLYDLLLDGTGALAGVLLYRLLTRKTRRNPVPTLPAGE